MGVVGSEFCSEVTGLCHVAWSSHSLSALNHFCQWWRPHTTACCHTPTHHNTRRNDFGTATPCSPGAGAQHRYTEEAPRKASRSSPSSRRRAGEAKTECEVSTYGVRVACQVARGDTVCVLWSRWLQWGCECRKRARATVSKVHCLPCFIGRRRTSRNSTFDVVSLLKALWAPVEQCGVALPRAR